MKKFKAYCRIGDKVMCMGVKDDKKIPEEEVDEETLKALEKDIRDMIEGRIKTIIGDEAVKMLSKLLKKDKG